MSPLARRNLPARVFLLLAYIALVAFGIFHHEPGVMESQAWLVARDSNVVDLLTVHMRHEGNPGLWHLLLMIPAKMGAPYIAANLLSLVVACGSVALLLFFSPLPLWLAGLLPFTFFFGFQYVIIARPYCLLTFFLFCVAAAYPSRSLRPGRYFILLGLLSLSSLHGSLLAVVLASFHFLEFKQSAQERRKALLSYLLFTFLLALIALELWPASDYSFGILGERDYESFNFSPGHFIQIYGAILKSLTGLQLLSLFSVASAVYFFYRRATLSIYFCLTTVIVLLFSVKGYRFWHEGIVQIILVFSAWLAFYREPQTKHHFHGRKFFSAGLLAILLCQLWPAFLIYRYDLREEYSGSRLVANYLYAKSWQDKKIYGYGVPATFVLPYFSKNIFRNAAGAPPYLTYTKNEPFSLPVPDEEPGADIVVWGVWSTETASALEAQLSPKFRERMRLDKAIATPFFWKSRTNMNEQFLIFVRKEPPFVISTEISVPRKLSKEIRSGSGVMPIMLVDAKDKFGPPVFALTPIKNPHFPYRLDISEMEIRTQLKERGSAELPPLSSLVLRAYYYAKESYGPSEAFGFLRVQAPIGKAEKYSFQGFNPHAATCPPAGPLLSGKIRLDREVKARFPITKFILAVVGQPTTGNWKETRYELFASQKIDLAVSNIFRVPMPAQGSFPAHTGRLLVYLLDPRPCGAIDQTACAAQLVDKRDEDMSPVIPLTQESLITPLCGQQNLNLLGFYEKDWNTIPIPAELLN